MLKITTPAVQPIRTASGLYFFVYGDYKQSFYNIGKTSRFGKKFNAYQLYYP